MSAIRTFVFLDLETTGFPWQEYNNTKITELAMISVNRDTLLNTTPGQLPRVMQKVVLCLNPKRLIDQRVTAVTGLSNDLLKNENSFDVSTATIINEFLIRQQAPVCLVVHNGFGFDYPILQAHVNSSKMSLSENILCIDSLMMFKAIMKKIPINKEEQRPTVEIVIKDKYDDEFNDLDLDETDLVMIQNLERQYSESDLNVSDSLRINSTENTPEKCHTPSNLHSTENATGLSVRKQIKQPRQSFKLKNIYERLMNKPPCDAHRAENDCLILLECCIAMADVVVQWCDSNNVLFRDILPMETGKKFPVFKMTKVCLFPSS